VPLLANVKIFLSAVSAEFRNYRDSIRNDLTRPNVSVNVQEDFIPTGEETLDKLDDYIQQSDVVIHLVGNMSGAFAQPPSVDMIRQRYPDLTLRFPVLDPFLAPDGPALSYTQWECWLALYHHKVLFIAQATDDAPRHEEYQPSEDQKASQLAHLARLAQFERYPEITFTNADRLVIQLLRSKLNELMPPAPIASTKLERFRDVASSMLEMGEKNWKMPRLVAPLNLEIFEEKDKTETQLTNIGALSLEVNNGVNLVLFGEGGIGKTTLVLDLVAKMLAEKCPRIPLYVDAAYWARTNTGILEFIANSAAGQRYELTASELTKVADSGHLTLILNGWNEIPGNQKLTCFERFRELNSMIHALNMIVVTRSNKDCPDLSATIQVHVQGLTWHSQRNVIHSELDKNTAEALIEILVVDTSLRHAARSPLILKGLLAQAKKGEITASNVYELLGSVIDTFEESDQRQLILKEPPLLGRHRDYLTSLACRLTSNNETTSSRSELLPVISATSKQLFENGLINPPEPNDVLDALSSYHLIHVDGEAVRFAHQRFQEYFAASWLFHLCVDNEEDCISKLLDAINQPFWEDALSLVGGMLKGIDSHSKTRSLLVGIALKVDLGFACDISRACAFSKTDDSNLYDEIVNRVNSLCDSSISEVANYGLICLITSGFVNFVDRLWPLLESEDQQIRLTTYGFYSGGLSLTQLGDSAETRIATWSPQLQAQFIRELSDNPDNYSFLVNVANEAVENEVRAAAIFSLTWNFPASDASLLAWLNAPLDVQLDREVINMVSYLLEQGVINEEVNEKLESLSRELESEELILRLVLNFPKIVGPNAIDVILTRLRELDRNVDDSAMVKLAMKYAPDRLNALARALILSKRSAPDWVNKALQMQSAENKSEVFEAAWTRIHQEEPTCFNSELIGSLSNREQTLRSIQEWLIYSQSSRGKLSDIEKTRGRELDFLLANAPGDELLSIIMELGESASYHEATELLQLIRSRMQIGYSTTLDKSQWRPSLEAVQALIDIFGKKRSKEVVAEHKVHLLLCSIASLVAPADFNDFLLEGCRLYLESWEIFSKVSDQWQKERMGDRPNNPHLGNYLKSAMENWGFEALPHLVELLEHPHANKLIPEIIGSIVRQPWQNEKKDLFLSSGDYFKDGDERRAAKRVLCQPDETYQEATDVTARALAAKLTELVEQLQTEQTSKSSEWNEINAIYRMRGLLGAVSNTPSQEIVEPIMYALANGLTDIYSLVNTLTTLIGQGIFIEDPAVVARIEAMYNEEAKANWFDESKKNKMAELCQLMFFVKPVSLLSKSLSDYLIEWERFTYVNQIIEQLAVIPSEESWYFLLELGKTRKLSQDSYLKLAIALALSLRSVHFTEFLRNVADGTWFTWCNSPWDLERIAPYVLRVIEEDISYLDAFLEACEKSSASGADNFACAVLSLVPDRDAIRLSYGLNALDAGKIENSRVSPYNMLKNMFSLHVPIGDITSYEVHPKACNELRYSLFIRASVAGSSATIFKKLLVEVECQRRQEGRPSDEPRHPAIGDGVAWTEIFASAD
jgi:GTPase SAR1 family protein